MSIERLATWSAVGLVLVMAVLLVLPANATAPTVRPADAATEPACNTCHDNLYYLYDSGKAYCTTEARSRCVDCHGGDPAALDEATAHAGMIAHPVTNGDVSSCRDCHGEEYEAYVRTFGDIAGYSTRTRLSQASYQFTRPPLHDSTLHDMATEDTSLTTKFLLGLASVLIFAGGLAISKLLRH